MNFFKKEEKEPKDLKEVLEYLKKLDKSVKEVAEGLKNLKNEAKNSLNKVEIIRYNPFKDAGGDQSFSIAMLNDNKDGFVLTSLYGRDNNRIYAKPIKNGKTSYTLSEEEKEVIAKASGEKEDSKK